MPPIELSEFHQRVMTLLQSAGPAPVSATVAPGAPMPALATAARSFAEVYGADGRLLPALAAEATASGDPGLAGLLSALDTALHDGSLALEAGPEMAPRLTAFVYPVV